MEQVNQTKTSVPKENEKQLALQASNEFKLKKYDACVQCLKKLGDLRGNDPRITFNKAVVEYYQFGLCKTDDFRKCLVQVKKQLEQGMVNTGDELDDIDRSFLLYDEAIIHYFLRQPNSAINILERLFKVIEPLDDSLAVKVCFLLASLYISTYKLKQAQDIIFFIENVLFIPKPMTTHSAGDVKWEETQNNGGQQTKDVQIPDQFKSKVHMLKAQLYLNRKSLKECKRELKTLMNGNNSSPSALFMKSNFEYLRDNCPKAIKLLNISPKNGSVLESGQSLSTMFYNNMGCVHFRMGKYNLGVVYFRKALHENAAAMKSLPPMESSSSLSGRPLPTLGLNRKNEILYNLGVQLLFNGKPSAAIQCLMEAHELYNSNPLYWLRLAECCIGTHQQGLHDLMMHQGKRSGHVKSVIGSGRHRKIILSPIPDLSTQMNRESQSAAMPGPTLDFGNICLHNAMYLLPNSTEIKAALQNLLASESRNEGGEESSTEPKPTEPKVEFEFPAPPGSPLKLKDVMRLRLSIFACHAYVCLGLGDYVRALEMANELLQQPVLPGAYRFLGMLYKAEALVRLDKISDAIQELNPESIDNLSTSFDKFGDVNEPGNSIATLLMKSIHQDCELNFSKQQETRPKPPFPQSEREANAMILFNLASVYSLRNEYQKATRILQQVVKIGVPVSIKPHATLLAIYLELQQGNIGTALELLKRGEIIPSERLVDRMDITQLAQPPQSQTLQGVQQANNFGQLQQRSFAPGLLPGNHYSRTLDDYKQMVDSFHKY